MTAVTFIAKRELISGHDVGDTISLDLSCTDIAPARYAESERSQALGGKRETLLYHRAGKYEVSLAPIGGAALAAVIECLESVIAGEAFQFDPYGTVNTPHAPVTADLDTMSYSLQRSTRKGQGGANDLYTLQFTVRVLST